MPNEATSKTEHTSYNYIYSSIGYAELSDGTIQGSKTPSTFRGVNNKKIDFLNGEKNPKWRDQVKAHVNATTVASGERYTASVSPFSAVVDAVLWDPNWPSDKTKHFYSIYGYIPYESAFGIVNESQAVLTNVRNRVINQFISQCKAARSSIEGGQNIAELRSTLNSIRHPLTSLRKATLSYVSKVSKLKRSRNYRGGGGVKGLSNAITDTYLELKFGIIPTTHDIAKLIADAASTRFDVVPISANASEYHTSGFGDYDPPSPSFMSYPMKRSSKTKLSMRYKGAYRTGVDASGHVSMASKLQLLPDDWIPTIWDVLPYTWMLDYFVNVGDIIKSLSFVTSNLCWGCVTTRRETSVTFAGNGKPESYGLINNPTHRYSLNRFQAYGGNAVFKSVGFNRDLMYNSDLMPTFEIKVPTSITPYINSAAVVVQNAWRLFSKHSFSY